MSTWRKVCCCLIAAVCGASAAFADGALGTRIRGLVSLPGTAIFKDLWKVFDSQTPKASDAWSNWGNDSALNYDTTYDVGAPHVVQVGFIVRDNFGVSRSKGIKVYGKNAPDGEETLLYTTPAAGFTTTGAAVTNFADRVAGTESSAFRYYRITPNTDDKHPNYHVLFFSDDMQVMQKCATCDSTKLNTELEAPKFTGKVVHLPNGGTATVKLMVAPTDHDYDLAAWEADPNVHAYTYDGEVAAGESFTLFATGLSAGRWYGRVFAIQGDKSVASQCTADFAFGTSSYWPTAYLPSNATGNKACSDGVLGSHPDSNTSPQWAIYETDNPDVEIVGFRYWTRTDISWAYRSWQAQLQMATNRGDFGATSVESTVKARVLKYAELKPAVTWTQVCKLGEADLYDCDSSRYYIEYPLHLPARHVRYLCLQGVENFNWRELELRTLPRPVTPEVTVTLGEPSGTYVGLSGYLDYRGNAQSDCSVHVSCVPRGSAKDYREIATGWGNESAWADTIQGLQGETDYDIDVIVSNALAGVTALSAQFTTPEAVVEPAKVEFLSVSPSNDGSVTFDWNVIFAGTDAQTADIYVRWGADAEHLGEGVLLREGAGIGPGSAVCDEVPPGADLVFALYSVNDKGVTGDNTASRTATTFGPSSFESAKIVRKGTQGVSASGSVGTIGLGTSDVYISWNVSGSAETNFVKIATFDQTSVSRAYSGSCTMPVSDEVDCRLVVSNAARGCSWMVSAAETHLLVGVDLPLVLRSDVKHSRNIPTLHDNNLGSLDCDNGGPYYIDLGSPQPVVGVLCCARPHNVNNTQAFKTFSVWTSDDCKTWAQAWTNADVMTFRANETYTDLVFPDGVRTARFLKLTSTQPGNLGLHEVRVLGSPASLALELKQPSPWGSGSAAPRLKDDPNGVWFSGRLVGSGSARVYACAAKADFGGDADAWLANGFSADLGEYAAVAAGTAVSGSLKAPTGVYNTRLVAVSSDGRKSVSSEKFVTMVCSKFYDTPLYVPATITATIRDEVYDDKIEYKDSSWDGSFIFPIEPGKVIAGIRLWPRNTWSTGYYNIYWLGVSMTADDATFELTELRTEPKTIKTYATDASARCNWQEVVNLDWRTDIQFDCANNVGQGCIELPILKPVRGAKFIRLNGINGNQIREIEIRYMRVAGTVLMVK